MLYRPAAEDEDFTLTDATLLFLCPRSPAQSFESRPELALAHDGNCSPGSPDSSRSLLHLQWKCLFLLRSARPNLISASRSQPARQPQRRSHLRDQSSRDHFMGKVEKPEVCYQVKRDKTGEEENFLSIVPLIISVRIKNIFMKLVTATEVIK